MTPAEAFNLALQRHHEGDLAAAQSLYRQVLAEHPGHADALHLMGVIASQTGRHAAAVELIQRAITLNPAAADYHGNLGLAFYGLGNDPAAISAYRQALSRQPAHPQALHNLADALCRTGQWQEAVAAYHRAIALRPDFPPTHCNLARALVHLQQWEDAIAHCRLALALDPHLAEAYVTLGSAHRYRMELDQSIAALEQAIHLQPNFAEAIANLASAHKAAGQIPESLACSRRAIERVPNEAAVHSNYLYTQVFSPDHDARELLREAQIWNQRHATSNVNRIPARSPSGRLKIGYLSPNFRHHSQAPFIHPLLRFHDHARFEIFAYSDGVRRDAITEKIQACCDVWRESKCLTDEALFAQIQSDQIDILVDLTMHMAHGRPKLFAAKPAPIQVAWLAYPGTTGVAAIDYRFTDAYLDPPGETDACYTEKSIRLPRTFACFDPLALEPESPLTPPPALSNRYITFGCLNNFCKVHDGVLRLWSRVMLDLPGSRLRLLAPEGRSRQRVLQSLQHQGIDAERVEFVAYRPRPEYLSEFAQIDICLDTLPYNGHTTTLESLWQGVPVITRRGATAAGRAATSVLHNLGIPELAAENDDQFVQIARQLAADLPRLTELRQTLRRRLLVSPVTDAAQFAQQVESAFQKMWAAYRAG